jgi:predicted restriction endonuclease
VDRKIFLERIINEFEAWWTNDPHSSNMDFYQNTITAPQLASLSNKKFVEFFYEFVSEGGRVQSGGYRTKNSFRNMLEKDIDGFRKFVLEPFQVEFSLRDWFLQLEDYPGFGVGIATIYLNRIDNKKYPIMNNKTLKALRKLGYKISSSKNWTNYELVRKYQDSLLDDFPTLQNYFKADALNHFIIAVYQGQELISDFLQIENFENELEQHEIENSVEVDSEKINKEELYKKIIECENEKSEKITINGKAYKRNNYLMVQIKKYRNYKCQFCSTTIPKASGGYYIEACHIKPKAEGGKDSLDNILILCPNCHKLFDYGKRSNENKSKATYSVTLNEKTYKALLK